MKNAFIVFPEGWEPSCCNTATFDRGCGWRRGCVQTKTFRKDSEASSRAERGRGYVILFSNEPSCCYVATSERRRIRLKADFQYFALRGASIRRSQRSNSEAVLFRGTLPRRCSIRRSQRGNNSATPYTLSTTFVATPIHLLIVRGNCEALLFA